MIKQRLYKSREELFHNLLGKEWMDDYFPLSNFVLPSPNKAEIIKLELNINEGYIRQQLLVFSLKVRRKIRENIFILEQFNLEKDVFNNKIYLDLIKKLEINDNPYLENTIKLKSLLLDYWQEFWLISLSLISIKYQNIIKQRIRAELIDKFDLLFTYSLQKKGDRFALAQAHYEKFVPEFNFISYLYEELSKDIIEAWNCLYQINQSYSYVSKELKNE